MIQYLNRGDTERTASGLNTLENPFHVLRFTAFLNRQDAKLAKNFFKEQQAL
jgi:hypothetical protein